MAAPALTPEQKLATQIRNTDEYLFNLALEDFLAVAKVQEGKILGLDWSTNGCSSAPNTPFNFDFLPACIRHDFGYHNYIAQKRCGAENKKRIDKNFKNDLYTQCAVENEEIKREACESVANVYYASVRVFGKSHFCCCMVKLADDETGW
ncbi:hypothetical protein IQ06DRAFT_347645 [Phaeosphaeriaceae sp. SRC1lsM3a]|nr:hypothetical protein IQ06DRAFT_347645 [Stagonospora sp. SRC1lsM3a]